MDFDVISPKTREALLEAMEACRDKKYRFGAGYTDLINDLNANPQEDLTVINLAQLQDDVFSSITEDDSGLHIGALVTAAQVLDNEYVQTHYPVLWEAANSVASMQIRQTATLAGNICQASPSGDMSCALVALNAVCDIINTRDEMRIEPLADFFRGVKKTSLAKDEILRSIFIPKNIQYNIKSGYVKIGTRVSMEIAILSVAYHLQVDEKNIIAAAGIAIGAVAPTIKYTQTACEFLVGRSLYEIKDVVLENFSSRILSYAAPISDVRASAWYRTTVLENVTKTIFD